MSKIAALILLEIKRFLSKRNVIILSIILLFSILSIRNGISDYNRIISDSKEFKVVEDSLFKNIRNYVVYSKNGIKINFVPSPNMILFSNPSIMTEISSRINSVIRLGIYNNSKRKLLIDGGFPSRLVFSDVIMLLGGLAVLFFGFDIFRRKEFLMFLSTEFSYRSFYFTIVIVRLVLIILSYSCLLGTMLLMMQIEGISLDQIYFSSIYGYSLSAVILLIFFFFLGIVIGSLKSRERGPTTIFIVWLIAIIFIPLALNYTIEKKTESISSPFKLDRDKYRVVTGFENYAEEKYGKVNKDDLKSERAIVEDYFKNYYKKIEILEENFKAEIVTVIHSSNKLFLWTPISFYKLTANESSSRGFVNYLEFYSYLQKLRKDFLRFWIDRVYYHDPNEMVNFIKDDENLFHAQSRLPDNFAAGVAINMGYIIILFSVSFFLFKRSLYHMKPEEIETLGPIDLELDRGDLSTWTVEGDIFEKFLYNLFSGRLYDLKKIGLQGEFLLNDKDILSQPFEESFFYLCKPDDIPGDLKVKDLLLYTVSASGTGKSVAQSLLDRPEIKPISNKTFGQLDKRKKFDALLALLLATKKDVYLIPNVASMYPKDCWIKLKDRLDQMKVDSLVINLVVSEMEVISSIDGKNCYADGGGWEYNIEVIRLKALHAERRKKKAEQVKSE